MSSPPEPISSRCRPTTSYYCPTSPNSLARKSKNGEDNIDPALRNQHSATRVSSLVPAFFPDDEPHNLDDLEDQITPRERAFRRIHISYDDGASEHKEDDSDRHESPTRSGESSRSASPPPPTGPKSFNRELYPGYDEFGRRHGLEHLNYPEPSEQNAGSYYRPRTHYYEPPSSAKEPPAPAPPHKVMAIPSFSPGGPPTIIAQHSNGLPIPADLAQMYYPGIPIPPKGIEELLGLEPGTPISLHSLKDPEPGQKPEYTYAVLCKLAIWSSPRKCMTLQEIYDALEERFPYFKNIQSSAWKVRHSKEISVGAPLKLSPCRCLYDIVFLSSLFFRRNPDPLRILARVITGISTSARAKVTSECVNEIGNHPNELWLLQLQPRPKRLRDLRTMVETKAKIRNCQTSNRP